MRIADIARYIFLTYCVACLVMVNFTGVEPETLLILMKIFVVFAFVNFIFALGTYVCFFDLLILMGAMQWFYANIWLRENMPILAFRPVNHFYATFFTYTSLLAIVLLSFRPSLLHEKTKDLISKVAKIENLDSFGKFFFYTGFIFSFIKDFVGNLPTIGQLMHVFSQFGYVSMICFIFSKSKRKGVYISFMLLWTLYICIRSTLFWPIIFWSLFFFIIYSIRHKVTFFFKLSLVGVGIVLVIFVQSFKQQLRAETSFRPEYLQQGSGSFTAFSDLANQRLSSLGTGADVNKLFLGTFFMRMNQAMWDNWSISRVDQSGNFLDGESVYKAAIGAFIPRVFWPDKPKFDNSLLTRLTGSKINAFISISILAEAYVNFKFLGGAVFVILYGLLLRGYYNLILRWSYRRSVLYFIFFPFLFFTFTRTEVDFVQTIYSMVSSTITLVGMFIFMQRFNLFNIRKTKYALLGEK